MVHHRLKPILLLLELNLELEDDLHLDTRLSGCAVVHTVFGVQMPEVMLAIRNANNKDRRFYLLRESLQVIEDHIAAGPFARTSTVF